MEKVLCGCERVSLHSDPDLCASQCRLIRTVWVRKKNKLLFLDILVKIYKNFFKFIFLSLDEVIFDILCRGGGIWGRRASACCWTLTYCQPVFFRGWMEAAWLERHTAQGYYRRSRSNVDFWCIFTYVRGEVKSSSNNFIGGRVLACGLHQIHYGITGKTAADQVGLSQVKTVGILWLQASHWWW